jgi:uncharacterized membrane protein YgcG
MRILKTCKLLLLVMSFTVLSAAAAAAQQYQILRADYGYADQRVDVTHRLRELARKDSRFRISNHTFGVDPSQGNVKSLFVLARGPQGDTRTFEYREGSVIDGAQFAGWSRGDWGEPGNGPGEAFVPGGYPQNGDSGAYTILHAEYGTDQNHVDVTDRLRDLARRDRTFRMGNDTFGVDPDRGRVKELRIYARDPNGQERMFQFQEGTVIDGSQFRGWGGGDWGRGGWSGNWGGGGFQGGGGYQGGRDEGQYTIINADYGTKHHHVDVTDRLRDLARRDLTFRMGNDTFGVDPDRGRVKTLRIYARGPDGQKRVFEYREGSIVDGSQFRGWSRGDWRNRDRDDRDRDDRR